MRPRPRLTDRVLRGFEAIRLTFKETGQFRGRRRPDCDVRAALRWAQKMRTYRFRRKVFKSREADDVLAASPEAHDDP